MARYPSLRLATMLAAASIGVAACGGGGAKAATNTTSKRPHMASVPPAVQIKANWQAFFAPTTPISEKEKLLQNGQQFAQVMKAGQKNPLAKSVAAKVSKVTLAPSGKTAKVVYSVTLGGRPALSNQKGTAVLQNRTWKVGDGSFCALLALEGPLPPACPSK